MARLTKTPAASAILLMRSRGIKHLLVHCFIHPLGDELNGVLTFVIAEIFNVMTGVDCDHVALRDARDHLPIAIGKERRMPTVQFGPRLLPIPLREFGAPIDAGEFESSLANVLWGRSAETARMIQDFRERSADGFHASPLTQSAARSRGGSKSSACLR